MSTETTPTLETAVRAALHAAVAPIPPAVAGGRVAGQAAALQAAAALVERAGDSAYLYVTLHPYPDAPIDVLVTPPYRREHPDQERGHTEITGMGILAALLDAPVTVTVYPAARNPLWLACTGLFHGHQVEAYAHIPGGADLRAAAEQLAVATAGNGAGVTR